MISPIDRRAVLAGLAGAGLFPFDRAIGATAMTQDLSHLTPEQRERFEAARARMMAALPYERITVPGTQALAGWERLKASGRGWPVVIGGDEALERIADQFSIDDPELFGGPMAPGPRPIAEIVQAAANLHFPADLARWPGAYREEDLRAPIGEWPDGDPTGASGEDGLTVAHDMRSGRAFEQVHILLIPTQDGSEVPAYLRWGNWNACPPPEYHVAALRSWHERYGVELVGIDGDTMNLRAARRPGSREEALALARELYRYCPDIVDQGAGTLSALAATLMASDWWFFWWD